MLLEHRCSEGAIVGRSIFRMFYTPKILPSESFCFEGSIFRKCCRGTDVPKVLCSDRWSDCVMFDDPTTLLSDWHDSTTMGKVFLAPAMYNNSFAGWSFRNVWNITYLSKCLFNPLMTRGRCIYMTGEMVMRCQRGHALIIIDSHDLKEPNHPIC